MVNQELLDYIKSATASGQSREAIQEGLTAILGQTYSSPENKESIANTSQQQKEINNVNTNYTQNNIQPQKVSSRSILPMAIIAGTAVIIVGVGVTFWILTRNTTTSAQLTTPLSTEAPEITESFIPPRSKAEGNIASTSVIASQKISNSIVPVRPAATSSLSAGTTTSPPLQMSTEKWMTMTPNNGPAWTSSHIDVKEPFNVVSFYYQFVTPAENLLSVFFDGQLVYRSDQRVAGETINHAKEVWVGDIDPGIHTISFRVDAFGKTYSTVRISPLSPALKSVLTAQTGASQVVYPGRTVVLNGSGSSDSRGVPLKYAWSQVKGVNITLSNPTASTTTFIAPPAGQILIFQLVVTNPDNKIASDHTVVQTVNMDDLNADGSIDTIDVDLLKSALNAPVIGLNDIRDLNNDGLITDADVHELTSFCTRPQCTIY
ncbi:MAG: peptidase, m36 (fungalysin) family protein [Candidatus Woesebacteria bacterium GW2011_GWB1_39_10]|uniref:Peptidase, m36 (Fungalysin) family protein n=1 Tax=Candidatus Woesebacteria bacterium GW2011_GWB1_39_10 TaxID=1618572 RepID=A0A0G0PPD8_9BACT|nr:MAG: peptidase, m36 (fungalysin) family protein [Candidatus Woesebacteria bacterium GW2011_GWB1_39_10]